MSKVAKLLLSAVAPLLMSAPAFADELVSNDWGVWVLWIYSASVETQFFITPESGTSTLESFFEIPGYGSGVTIGTGTFQPDFEIIPIPQQVSEPGLLALLGLGALGARFARRLRR